MRAKFKLVNMESTKGTFSDSDGKPVEKELYSLYMFPVYANSDGTQNTENKQYWEATPAGQIQLAVVNKHAVDSMDLKIGDELYVDFTKVVKDEDRSIKHHTV